MTAAVCAALLVAAWAGLCYGQARQHASGFGSEGTRGRRRAFAVAGWLLLAAALAVAMHGAETEFGPVLWAVLLSLTALGWVTAHAWRPRAARWLAAAALLLGVLGLPAFALI
ncbi:DUF3325 family protein [Luteimonas salinilitoris]|uniref:DUF3325 family protein n=1 Tax=Luteimonas salinilitoris TaxID=3237697 RepID=A0ABV4HLF8_9GAMM